MIQAIALIAFLVSTITHSIASAQLAPTPECLIIAEDYYGVGMTRSQAEQAYRNFMRQQYPDMAEAEFEFFAQYGMKKQRERAIRKQATCIKIKDKYPHLSRKERDLLVQDELARDQAAEEQRGGGVPAPPPLISCTQLRLGAMSSIDCY